MLIGASPNPCDETYAGPRAFSEPETTALAKFILKWGAKAYLSLHSYGQYILFPHGHTTKNPPDFEVLSQVGLRTGRAIRQRYGTEFTVGPPPVVLCELFSSHSFFEEVLQYFMVIILIFSVNRRYIRCQHGLGLRTKHHIGIYN